MTKFSIRQLSEDNWPLLKSLRLESLQSDPALFSANYADNLKHPDSEWQRRLNDPKCAYFSLFDGEDAIGLTGIFYDQNDLSNSTVSLVSSYIKPNYRKLGLSKLLYQARLDWAAMREGVKFVIVSRNENNIPSMKANQKWGFVLTHQTRENWPDGSTADQVYYRLDLNEYRQRHCS